MLPSFAMSSPRNGSAASSPCGAWNLDDLRQRHGVYSHTDEWRHSKCCWRRKPDQWAPDVDATLRPNSVRLVVLLVADSSNATQSLALANMAAFSHLRAVSTTFVAVVGRCEQWAGVAAAVTVLGMRFECVRQPAERAQAAGAAFRPKLPSQLVGYRHYLRVTRASERADAIWLPDADIAFGAEGISAFLLRWSCAFAAGPPLVAQAAMHGDAGRTTRSQQFWHLNYGREWQARAFCTSAALAVHSHGHSPPRHCTRQTVPGRPCHPCRVHVCGPCMAGVGPPRRLGRAGDAYSLC
jgi:hypothetical protein